MLYNDTFTHVVHLRCLGCPPAIPLTVRTVNVDPIKAVALGTLAHIGKEGFKRVSPFLRHRNASTAIRAVMFSVRIKAASFRVYPGIVLFSFGSAVSASPQNKTLRAVAAAAFKNPAQQMTTIHYRPCATRAFTQPPRASLDPSDIGDSRQSSENLASKVFEVVRVFGRFFFSHAAHPPMVSVCG